MIHVVVGLLFNAQGDILVAQRDQHKFQGGRWEFPGGKLEENESAFAALQRELKEEIGIHVTEATSWQQFQHTYPERTILLDVWRVTHFQGVPHGNEGQLIQWVSRDKLATLDIPDANREIIGLF